MAMGSACELEYHLLLVRDLNLLSVDEVEPLLVEAVRVKKMLASFIAKISAAISTV